MRITRPAGSLIEILVVIAILALLTGLTLAGIQRARLAAARARCDNNLRQIGIAAHQYAAVYGTFPPGVSYKNDTDPFPFMGWPTRLLPYLEQTPLWDQAVSAFEIDKDFLDNPPHYGLTIALPAFSCPLDSRTAQAQTLTGGVQRGLTSYLGMEGWNAARPDGMLYLNSAVRLADVTDGASNTLLVGERPASTDMVFGWWYAGWGQDKDGEGDMVLGARTKNNKTYAPSCPVGPYDYKPGNLDNQCDAFHFWSLHPGGTPFLFVDGSVHLVPYSANPIFPALASRAGGETVSLPD